MRMEREKKDTRWATGREGEVGVSVQRDMREEETGKRGNLVTDVTCRDGEDSTSTRANKPAGFAPMSSNSPPGRRS
jgi:hypothetical protein